MAKRLPKIGLVDLFNPEIEIFTKISPDQTKNVKYLILVFILQKLVAQYLLDWRFPTTGTHSNCGLEQGARETRTSNDNIAGNERVMVYQCIYLLMFIFSCYLQVTIL